MALLYSSKRGMTASILRQNREVWTEEDEEPPPDLLAECDSDETIAAIRDVLSERCPVFSIEADESSFSRLKKVKPDLVFNIAERLFGPNREGHVPTLCEILGIPYTGSDPLTLGICLDKSRAKEILTCHKIPNPSFWVIEHNTVLPNGIQLPVIVKPCHEGSSKGIRNGSVVKTEEELSDRIHDVLDFYKQPAIIEKFLPGREFTVGVLGNYPDLEVLPIVEIDHSKLPQGAVPIYSYEAKWIWDKPENPIQIFSCPADISDDLKQRIENLVAETCRILRVRDWGRIDVRLDESGEPNILEVNPLPGVLPNPEDNSCLPKAARTAGYSYSELILRVVDEALKRYKLT